jgi:hypothetical protein
MKLKMALLMFFVSGILFGDAVVHSFQQLWGSAPEREKVGLYWGWTNGFIQKRGDGAVEFAECLEKMTTEQAVAMVNKYYKDHPEKWARPFGEQILEALTVQGGTCEGKNPLAVQKK